MLVLNSACKHNTFVLKNAGRAENAGSNKGMAEILRFEFNVPEEIALKFPTGKEVEGRYGPQVMYTLTDSRIMYLDPNVADKISEMQIGAGEYFTIVKREKKDGRKKSAEYVIQRNTEQVPGSTAPIPSAPVSRNSTFASSSISTDTPQQDTLSALFRAAIDTLDDATRYGASKGRKLDFNEEDVRCLAVSLFISASKGGAHIWQR